MKEKLKCILLIDDDEGTNFLSSIIIEEADCVHHIKSEQCAKRALAYLSDSNSRIGVQSTQPFPDLIFLDINMPAINGWEFLEKYKAIKSGLLHTPIIIMLSTTLDPADKLKALAIPEVADLQSKPMSVSIINAVLAKYFPGYL